MPVLLLFSTLAVYGSLLHMLFVQTVAHEQLLHAFFVLALAGGLVFYESRVPLKPKWQLTNTVIGLLSANYILLILGWLTGWTLLLVPGLCCALAALAVYVLGDERIRMVVAWFSAFGAFVVLALLLPALDWPLRGLAGAWGAWALGLLGQQHELRLIAHDGVPMLLLLVNEMPFHVAPECNGFGVMTSSLLLSLLLVIQRVLPWVDKALTLVGALFLAFAANILRIIVIVLLAPLVGADNYMLMHEIVGGITYYGCLILIWLYAPGR